MSQKLCMTCFASLPCDPKRPRPSVKVQSVRLPNSEENPNCLCVPANSLISPSDSDRTMSGGGGAVPKIGDPDIVNTRILMDPKIRYPPNL